MTTFGDQWCSTFHRANFLCALHAFIFLINADAANAGTCKAGDWITEVENDGAVITLSDGSMWLVDEVDRVDTVLWLPTENVVICGKTIMNTDSDNERVNAEKFH